MAINVWTGEGRLVQRPEIRVNNNNKKVLYFTIAMDEGTKDKPFTNYQDCVAYEGTAETIAKYMDKGDQIIIHGRSHNYTTEDRGEKRKRQVMVVEKFSFGQKKRNENENKNEFRSEKRNDHFDSFESTYGELKFY